MEIVEYKPSDFYDVVSINRACHEFPEPNKQLREVVNKANRIWLAKTNSKTVGFLIATFKDNYPYVYNISVSPDSQCAGVGSALLDKFAAYYSLFPLLWLDVDANNPAQTLYFKKGYRVVNVVKDYYGEQKHALSMVKAQ